MLTWLSQAVRSKLFHAAEGRAEPAPLLLAAKGVDHPNTHAGAAQKEQHYRRPAQPGLNPILHATKLESLPGGISFWSLLVHNH